MSQVTRTTTTTTTLSVTCGLWSITNHCDGYASSHLCGPDNMGSVCGSATTDEYKRHSEGFCWSHHYAIVATASILVFCYNVCILLLGSHMTAVFTSWGSTNEVCNTPTLWSLPLAGMCTSWWWSVAHTRSALSGCITHCFEWGNFLLLIQLYPSHSILLVGHTASGAQERVILSLSFPYMGMGLLLQVVHHMMTWSTQNLVGVNLLNLVWWLGIRLMNLLTSGWQGISLLSHTFTLVVQVRCPC